MVDKPKNTEGPSGAPELDRSLLTAMQKRRIEAEFELDEHNPQQLKPAKALKVEVMEDTPRLKQEPKLTASVYDKPLAPRPTRPTPPSNVADDAATQPADTDAENAEAPDQPETLKVKKPKSRKPFWRRKAVIIPILFLALVGALAGVPYTRYYLASLVVKQQYAVTVTDVVTRKPVSSATVILDGRSGMTDKDGTVRLDGIKPGQHQLVITKKYYKDISQSVVVPIYGNDGHAGLELIATGRQVPINVSNKLTGKATENVTVKAAGTEIKTDKQGNASIVLPADKSDLEVSIVGDGFNRLIGRIKVTDQVVKENAFEIVPSGKVYFLSRQSGKIDVVKTNLDGSDRQTAIYGTGREDDRNTALIASRDWKYLALYAKRDSSPAKLYLIDTSNDKLTVMDSADAEITAIGWSGHQFAFTTLRDGAKQWEAGRQAIKTYDAGKKQLLTVDQNQAEGAAGNDKFQEFTKPYLVKDKLVYGVEWFSYSGSDLSDRMDSIRSVPVGSQSKKDLRTFPSVQYNAIQAKTHGPDSVYYAVWAVVDNKYDFFEYSNGQVKNSDIDQNRFVNTSYPTYLFSPDGNRTFWSESRDGRQTFFVGDQSAKNEKQVGVIDEAQSYGWYGNEYLLVSKKGSELYIVQADGGEPIKISDYHKPDLTYPGYSYGYGGL